MTSPKELVLELLHKELASVQSDMRWYKNHLSTYDDDFHKQKQKALKERVDAIQKTIETIETERPLL